MNEKGYFVTLPVDLVEHLGHKVLMFFDLLFRTSSPVSGSQRSGRGTSQRGYMDSSGVFSVNYLVPNLASDL